MIQSLTAVAFKLSVDFRTLGFLYSCNVIELEVTLLNCFEVSGRQHETVITRYAVWNWTHWKHISTLDSRMEFV